MNIESKAQSAEQKEGEALTAEDNMPQTETQKNKLRMTPLDIPMQNMSLEDDEYEENLDYNAAASSRAPPEPFEMEDFSEDDEIDEVLDIRKIPGFEEFVRARSGANPDAKLVLQYIDATFLKYGSIYAETNKWNTNAYDYYGFDDPDSSYSP